MIPQLSIITVNLNNLAGLKKTMESVFAQTFTDYEYIVIDGGSTDGSKGYIEHHSDKLAYWVSEHDGGIYQGMNKGVNFSKGNYLLFLNSGDYLYENISLKRAFDYDFKESIVYCNVISSSNGEVKIFPDYLTFDLFFRASINHQATFIKRDLLCKYGLYDEEYKIASDWIFLIKSIFLYNASTLHLDFSLSVFDFSNGIGSQFVSRELMLNERNETLKKYFPRFTSDYESAEKLKRLYEMRTYGSIRLNGKIVFWLNRVKRMFGKRKFPM